MWTQVNSIIDSHQKFLLTTHVNPDGDGIGSELALAIHLKSLGKEVLIINSHPIPTRYRFMDGENEIKVYQANRDLKTINDSEVIFILDTDVLDRLGVLGERVKSSPALKVCIDHHLGSEHDSFDLIVADEDASAVGEMIYRLIKSRGAGLSLRIAESLYISIMTDTGSFRFTSTTPGAHIAVADFIAAGVRPPEIYSKVYERSSAAWMRMLGQILAEMNFECEERLAWFKVTHEMLGSHLVSLEEAKEFLDFPRLVEKVEVILFFMEAEEVGKIKVSVRSKGRVAINGLAVQFGGGGHQYASGITIEGTIDEVVKKVLTEAKKLFS